MIKSFSVCANDRAKREVALLIKSIRQFYDCPIFVSCDFPTKLFLESFGFDNIQCELHLEPEKLECNDTLVRHVVEQNDFHSKSIILSKMDCIEWALEEAGETVFLDADIILLRPIEEDIDESMELILSPHFHVEDKITQNRTYGAFNAGYLWTSSKDFPQAWRDIYLTRSAFYEQQGMIHLFEQFDVKTFDKNHNVGFWRFPKVWKSKGRLSLTDPIENWAEVKSVHFHAFPETYAHADKGLIQGYDLLKEIIFDKLPDELKEFAYAI